MREGNDDGEGVGDVVFRQVTLETVDGAFQVIRQQPAAKEFQDRRFISTNGAPNACRAQRQ